MRQKRELWALEVTNWNARDYFDGGWGTSASVAYLFATSDEAKAFAMGISTDRECYNEAMLYHGELTEEVILEASGYDDIADFDEALREPYSDNWNIKNLGEDEKRAVAGYVMEEYDDTSEEIPCANYDFDKSIAGAIIVVWAWEKHVGYARDFIGLRYADHDETERLLAKEDKVFARQVDVVMTKEEVDACEDLQTELFNKLLLDSWKWTRPGHVEIEIEEFV